MPEILGGVRGMHDAYEFVKEKSPIIGPNVSYVLVSLLFSLSTAAAWLTSERLFLLLSLIYQLLEWERLLASETSHLPHNLVPASTTSSTFPAGASNMSRGFSTDSVESEEDWSRRRAELEAQEEAEMMDREMEVRIVAEREKSGRTGGSTQGLNGYGIGAGSGGGGIGLGKGGGGGGMGSLRMGIKRRVSGSSLASEITFEEDDEMSSAENPAAPTVVVSSSFSPDRRDVAPSSQLRSPLNSMSMDGITDGHSSSPETSRPRRRSGSHSGESFEHFPSPYSSPKPPFLPALFPSSATNATNIGSIGRNRKRSATLTFTPSLDPLPYSPTTVTTSSTQPEIPAEPNRTGSMEGRQQEENKASTVEDSMADLKLKNDGGSIKFARPSRPRARTSLDTFNAPPSSDRTTSSSADPSALLTTRVSVSPHNTSSTLLHHSSSTSTHSPYSRSSIASLQSANSSSRSSSRASSRRSSLSYSLLSASPPIVLPASQNLAPLPPVSLHQLLFGTIATSSPSSAFSIDPSTPTSATSLYSPAPSASSSVYSPAPSPASHQQSFGFANTTDHHGEDEDVSPERTPQSNSISTFSSSLSPAFPSPPRQPQSSLRARRSLSPHSPPSSTATPTQPFSFTPSKPLPSSLNGPFGTHQSPTQRKQAHRRAFSVDVLSFGLPSPSSSPPTPSSTTSPSSSSGTTAKPAAATRSGFAPIRSSLLASGDQSSSSVGGKAGRPRGASIGGEKAGGSFRGGLVEGLLGGELSGGRGGERSRRGVRGAPSGTDGVMVDADAIPTGTTSAGMKKGVTSANFSFGKNRPES
jgi:hypothetical protein